MTEPPLGSLGLTQIHGPVGLGIRIGQYLNGDGFANFEHVVIYIGNGLIVEAEPGGARIAELTEYDDATMVWLHCPPQYAQAVADAARELVGTPYSFLDYDALALHRLHIPAPGLRSYISDSGHAICSQLADIAAQRGGWTLFDDGRWPGYVVPAHIYGLYLEQLAARGTGAP